MDRRIDPFENRVDLGVPPSKSRNHSQGLAFPPVNKVQKSRREHKKRDYGKKDLSFHQSVIEVHHDVDSPPSSELYSHEPKPLH
ncbi:hypothetical protein KQX54_006470 [Cotesia glomerata]|uniref:Uncharacterized protein n=1 Tax=Cotesia glomerata TaxID=32391 RepID=A0AAV7HZR5_COTGL|nr:hypothetical protein KQX54_006470 [Cotesia glomerata]